MEKWKINNPAVDLISGVIFLVVGIFMLINNTRLSDALTESNEVFWKRLNLFQVKKSDSVMTRITTLLIGIAFVIGGIILIYRSVVAW